jgi:ribonuclease-3
MVADPLENLQSKLGYHFKNPKWATKALTHSSTGNAKNYERLEFVGDRVLGLVMAEVLFTTFPDESEGGLAKRHSALVQGRTLADIAQEINLGEDVILSAAEREAGGAENENILADVMEALFAALYLDGGLEAVKEIIIKLWGDRVQTLKKAPQDPKTALQEWVQARGLPLPEYDVVNRQGPDHQPVFTVQVDVVGYAPVHAEGSSRRQAEKAAAKAMLSTLKKGKKA